GWALFGIIGLGWYLWIGQTVPGLLEYFLYDETFARVATEAHGRPGPVWYFIGVLLAGLFPWTAFFAGSLPEVWREARDTSKIWGMPLFLWLAVPFLVLSLAKSKLAPYALPLLVPASLMTGIYLSRLFAADDDEPFAYKLESALTIMGLAILGVAVMTISILGFLPDPKIARIAYFIAFYFMFLAVFGYSFMNLGIVKGIMLVLGVTVPGIMLLLLPAINGDEEIWKGSRLPGYRALLQEVATLPPTSRILFVDDVLEGSRFYTGKNIPTWNVKREKRFDPRAQTMVLDGDEILRMMAAPDLYLLMREKTRDRARYITKYSIEEVRRLGKWGLYVCGRPLNDSEAAMIAVQNPVGDSTASGAETMDVAGSGLEALAPASHIASGGKTIPGAAHIDAILTPGKQVDPIAAEWAAAMAKRSTAQASITLPIPSPAPKKAGSAQKPAAVASAPVRTPATKIASPAAPAPKPNTPSSAMTPAVNRISSAVPPISAAVKAPPISTSPTPATISEPVKSAPAASASQVVASPAADLKPETKPASKSPAKPSEKVPQKPATKGPAKPPLKPAPKPAANPAQKAEAKPAPVQAPAPPPESVYTTPVPQNYENGTMKNSVRSNQPPKR
ncbi:MAG TPA: hypothetical protein VIV61_06625, partial [Candidatus Ozemobacteraceae bacterium]